MTDYKHISEAGLKFSFFKYQICQLDEFDDIERQAAKDELKAYNLYFICQRNKIGINPDYIKINKNSIELEFEVYDNRGNYNVPFVIKNTFNSNSLSIKSKYPYDNFELINENNESVYFNKSTYVLDECLFDDNFSFIVPRPSFLDFDILYIGQSMRNSNKPVIDRLKMSHKTLKKIIKEEENIDKDIYIILCSFIMDGIIEIKGETINIEVESERLNNFIKIGLKLTPRQETTLTEAALIKYFQPKYNVHYKNSFPKKHNKSYDECYKLDLNSISIRINSELIFFSESIETNNNHLINFPLVNYLDRQQLFYI